MPSAPPSVAERYNHLENQVSAVAATLDGFIKDSQENRNRTEREQTAIWAAIREQGDNLRNAIEKLSARGQISFTVIATTVGLILSISSAAAMVGHQLMMAQIKQLEIRDEYAMEIFKIKTQTLLELGHENHESIREFRSAK